MAEAREIERNVVEAQGALAAADTLDEALGTLASALSHRYPISRVSLRTYDPRTEELEIVGVWSASATHLGVGVRVPARSTSFAEVELRGAALLGDSPVPGDPLLDQIVRDEGNRSWVVMPITRDRLVVGLLSVSSHEPDTFSSDDLPFFDALSGAISERLLELVAA
jgi:transcriptional regulator with GAF, ATPase, and Fis domain